MKKNNSKLFQVEWDQDGKKVEIHLDNMGIEYLISLLNKLRETSAPNDLQLMSPEWGGSELTADQKAGLTEIVNHLKIYKWAEEK